MDTRDRAVAVPLDLVEPALASRHLRGQRGQHRLVSRQIGSRTPVVALSQQQPVLLVAVHRCRHERPDALQPLAAEAKREPPVPLLLQELVPTPIPDLDCSRPVLALRDLPLERGIGERMILHMYREPAGAAVHRAGPWERPSSRALRSARGGDRSEDGGLRAAARRRSARHRPPGHFRTAPSSEPDRAFACIPRACSYQPSPERDVFVTDDSQAVNRSGDNSVGPVDTSIGGYQLAKTPIPRNLALRLRIRLSGASSSTSTSAASRPSPSRSAAAS